MNPGETEALLWWIQTKESQNLNALVRDIIPANSEMPTGEEVYQLLYYFRGEQLSELYHLPTMQPKEEVLDMLAQVFGVPRHECWMLHFGCLFAGLRYGSCIVNCRNYLDIECNMCEDMLPHGKPRPVQLRMMRSIEILVLLLELVVVAHSTASN